MRSERAKQRTRKYAHVKRHTARVKHIQAGGAVAEPVLLARVVELGRRRQLKQLLAELELQRPQRPSVRVFNAAVHACCRCGALDQAFELLYFMEVRARAFYHFENCFIRNSSWMSSLDAGCFNPSRLPEATERDTESG